MWEADVVSFISTVFQHCVRAFLIAFLFCFSTFLCAHPYGIPALSACIPTNLQHSLHAFFLHVYCMWTFVSVRISTVFQHCRRAFLLHCSTLCMLFYYTPVLYSSTVCVHFCYIQALFWLHLHTFVCVSFNACIPFIIFKRNGDLTGGNGIPEFNLSSSQPLNLSTSQPVWRRLNLSTCISTVFQHCVRAFLLQAIVLQHFSLCASLLYSSIACVHLYYVQALSCTHFYCF